VFNSVLHQIFLGKSKIDCSSNVFLLTSACCAGEIQRTIDCDILHLLFCIDGKMVTAYFLFQIKFLLLPRFSLQAC